MKLINELNSVFTELNPEDAVSINGGARFTVNPVDGVANNYIVRKYKDDARTKLLWKIKVDNKGTFGYRGSKKDDVATILPGPQPKRPNNAKSVAKNKVENFLKD